MRFYLLSLVFWFTSASLRAAPVDCEGWFGSAEIKPGLSCTYDCVGIATTSETSACPLKCPELCDATFMGVGFFKVSDLYPGLTPAERAIVAESPKDAVKAYAYSWKAEKLCHGIYPVSATNDESDACRHFIWAGLLTKKLGAEKAKRVLDAHENNPDEPLEEKSMDLANNRAGILACQTLGKKCDQQTLVEEFLAELNGQKLIVLKPKKKGQGK